MTYKKKVDANQADIVALFRSLGAKVRPTHEIGGGFPDLIVEYRYPSRRTNGLKTMLVEIKDGSLSPSRRQLTPDQKKFHSIFHCYIVESEQDVYDLLEITYKD